MSLERKDIRLKADPDDHTVIRLVADAHGMDIGEWVERVAVREARRQLHAAMVLAADAQRLGIAGNARGAARDLPGAAGKRQE